ncbi:hypothetical protein PM082_010666 [Marasmius tenuissimus]|nr:hypothetical protein PM082_010666 [Marasmius tenuissimus]
MQEAEKDEKQEHDIKRTSWKASTDANSAPHLSGEPMVSEASHFTGFMTVLANSMMDSSVKTSGGIEFNHAEKRFTLTFVCPIGQQCVRRVQLKS